MDFEEKTTPKGWRPNDRRFKVAIEYGHLLSRKEYERRLDKHIANGLRFFEQLNRVPEGTTILVSRY